MSELKSDTVKPLRTSVSRNPATYWCPNTKLNNCKTTSDISKSQFPATYWCPNARLTDSRNSKSTHKNKLIDTDERKEITNKTQRPKPFHQNKLNQQLTPSTHFATNWCDMRPTDVRMPKGASELQQPGGKRKMNSKSQCDLLMSERVTYWCATHWCENA